MYILLRVFLPFEAIPRFSVTATVYKNPTKEIDLCRSINERERVPNAQTGNSQICDECYHLHCPFNSTSRIRILVRSMSYSIGGLS